MSPLFLRRPQLPLTLLFDLAHHLAGIRPAALKAIHAQEDLPAAKEKAQAVAAKLREMKLAKAAEIVASGVVETMSYYAFPREHWRCLRTNNPMERLNREIRTRTRVVGNFLRRHLGADAGGGASPARGRHPLGNAKVSGHDPAA
jgi:hypothetical protein